MAKYTPEELQDAISTLESAGDAQAANVLRNQLKNVNLHVPRNNNSSNSSDLGNAVDLAKGVKTGFDKAAYALADLTPDVPVPDSVRDGWNNNVLVKALGITAPDREERNLIVDEGKKQADQTTLGRVGNVAGEVAPAIALAAGTGGTSLIPQAIGQATLAYATTPGDTLNRSTSGMAAATGESVGRAIPNAVASIIRPMSHRPEVQRLLDKGVVPLYGQALGGNWKKTEEVLTSFPGVGGAIENAQDKALAQGAKYGLEAGGIKVPAAGFPGQRAVSDYFDDAFPNAVKNLSFDLTEPGFIKSIDDIARKRNLDKKGYKQLQKFLNNFAENLNIKMPDPKSRGMVLPDEVPLRQIISGKDLHALMTKLREESQRFAKSTDPYHQELGKSYRDLLDVVEKRMLNNPANKAEDVANFKKVREQYRLTKPAMLAGEQATVNRKKGIPNPEQYQKALVDNLKKKGNKKAIREGTDEQQQFANDLVEVLGDKYPDSGTGLRVLLSGGLMGGLGYLAEDPAAGAAGGAGLLAASLLSRGAYAQPVRRAILGDYGLQRIMADALRKTSNVTGAAGAAAGPQIIQE